MNIEPDNEGLIRLSYTGQCTMELTPFMEERFRDVFDLELEMLRGTRENLADGRTRFVMTITSEEKGRMILDFLRMLGCHTTCLN